MFEIPEQMNVTDMFVDRNVREGRGDKTAVVDTGEGRSFTYSQVQERVNRFGNVLRETLGTRLEERVLLLLLDSEPFVASFFGSIKVGAVPIPTNTMFTPAEYEYLLNDSRARVLVIHAEILEQVSPILDNTRYLEHVVVVGHAPSLEKQEGISVHQFEDLLAESSPELEPEVMSKDDACLWLYSSGTTGFPKGAVHLQHDMLYTSEHYARQVIGFSEEDRVFSVAKLFFAYGLGNALYFPFYVGGTTILYPAKPDPETFFSIIDEHKPTILFSIPTAYLGMLGIEDAEERFDISSLRVCVSSGEPLPQPVWEQWRERFGLELLNGIGSTEILHIFISNYPGRSRHGSTGQLVPGYEAKLLAQEGEEVPMGEVGDLLISGDSICAFYWNKHEKTKDAIQGRWIRTGDKYSVDEDGHYYYQGRSDDMLRAGGSWVSPVEVEATLVEHPAVLECGVVGTEDEAGLIKPKAYVVLASGYTASPELEEELIAHVKARIARYKYPRWVTFLDELPRTATGKVQRYKLRQMV